MDIDKIEAQLIADHPKITNTDELEALCVDIGALCDKYDLAGKFSWAAYKSSNDDSWCRNEPNYGIHCSFADTPYRFDLGYYGGACADRYIWEYPHEDCTDCTDIFEGFKQVVFYKMVEIYPEIKKAISPLDLEPHSPIFSEDECDASMDDAKETEDLREMKHHLNDCVIMRFYEQAFDSDDFCGLMNGVVKILEG